MFGKPRSVLIVVAIIVGAVVYAYLSGFFAPGRQVTVERYDGEVGEGQTFDGLTPEALVTDDREASARFRNREYPRVAVTVGGEIEVKERNRRWQLNGNIDCEMYRSIPTPRELRISSPYTIENFVVKWRREGDYKIIIITNTQGTTDTQDDVSKTFRIRVEETP